MRIKPVILSGGSGTRLWPSSRKSLPKQFIDFPVIGSLFSRTLSRASQIGDAARPLIISGKQHGFLCHQAAEDAGIKAEFIFEETGRNTAPAIYFAALASRPEDVLLVMPSDHWIEDADAFADMVTRAATVCADAKWVTFGVAPSMAATGYGYIEVAAREDGVMDVVSFTEKPDEATAKTYISAGTYFWNSGIFMVRADTCLESFRRLQPALSAAADSCWSARTRHDSETVLPADRLEEIESISVDYAVMERTRRGAAVPLDAGWSDIGSWLALHGVLPQDQLGNAVIGDARPLGSEGCLLASSGRLLAAVGLRDLLVVDTGDAVLVSPLDAADDLRALVAKLEAEGRTEVSVPSAGSTAWGHFEILARGPGYAVRRLVVAPGALAPLAAGAHCVVAGGVGRLESGAEVSMGQPFTASGGVANPGDEPLVVIETVTDVTRAETGIARTEDGIDTGTTREDGTETGTRTDALPDHPSPGDAVGTTSRTTAASRGFVPR